MIKLLQLLTALIFSVSVFAQAKVDKVYLNDGSVLEVHVKKVTASSIEYAYPGETAQNEESVKNVRTIVFASGRVQQFNTGDNNAAPPVPPAPPVHPQRPGIVYQAVRPNEMAILPVAFIDKNSGELSEEKSKLAQAEIYNFFDNNKSRINPIYLQDGRTTNASLKKAGIAIADLDAMTIEDLEKVLGAEYLILSKVSYTTKTNVTSNQSTYGKSEKKDNKNTVAVNTSTYANENTSYAYTVILEIYKGGQKVYNETRQPFFSMEGSWKDAYEYMLKRTPIYKRK